MTAKAREVRPLPSMKGWMATRMYWLMADLMVGWISLDSLSFSQSIKSVTRYGTSMAGGGRWAISPVRVFFRTTCW